MSPGPEYASEGHAGRLGVIPTRGIKEVFESVRVEASKKGGLTFLGTDLEVSMRYSIPPGDGLEIAEEGMLLAPARRLTAILTELPEEPVALGFSKGTCTIKSTSGSFRISAGTADFPAIEVPDTARGIEIDRTSEGPGGAHRLRGAREKMRYALNGILLLAKGDHLQGVSTDGRRSPTSREVPQPGSRRAGHRPHEGHDPAGPRAPGRRRVGEARLLREPGGRRHRPAVVMARLGRGPSPTSRRSSRSNARRSPPCAARTLRPASAAPRSSSQREGPAGSSVRLRFEEGKDLVISATVADVGEAVVSSLHVKGKGERSATTRTSSSTP